MTQQELSEKELDVIHEQVSLLVVKNRLKNKTHSALASIFDPISENEFMEAYKEISVKK